MASIVVWEGEVGVEGDGGGFALSEGLHFGSSWAEGPFLVE